MVRIYGNTFGKFKKIGLSFSREIINANSKEDSILFFTETNSEVVSGKEDHIINF